MDEARQHEQQQDHQLLGGRRQVHRVSPRLGEWAAPSNGAAARRRVGIGVGEVQPVHPGPFRPFRAAVVADAGLSHFDYQVLAMLSMASERTARMGELAALANGWESRVSHVVSRLEAEGWVRRCGGSANRRTVLAALTDTGWEKVVATVPGHVGAVRRCVFYQLTTAQVRQLEQIAARICRAVDPTGSTATSTTPIPTPAAAARRRRSLT